MTISLWTRIVRSASLVGLGAFALVTVAAPADAAVSAFFNVWVYNGLLVLACATAASVARALATLVRDRLETERAA